MLPHVVLKSHRTGSRGGRGLLTAGLAALAALLAGVGVTDAQELPAGPDRIAVFLDCNFCDESFIRQELNYVDYVRDREVAHVHVLVTRQSTGSGGEANTFRVIGRPPFEAMEYSTVFTSGVGATDDEKREGLLRTLQAALVPYLLQTPLGSQLSVRLEGPSDAGQVAPEDDRWRNWTFEVYADGNANFESQQESFTTRYGFYASRVTEDWKIQLRPFFNYSYDRFERDDRTITSTSRRDGVTSYVVGSISSHWSAGAFADLFTSTFDNVDRRIRLMPAIEYSVFPYREATRRQLTVAYRAGASHIIYRDTTIYNEIRQLLPEHSLTADYEVTQPWGRVDVGVDASQYLHDLERYRVLTGARLEVRVTRGLSVEVGGDMAFIHNQLNLPKGDADLEEVLLRRRQLETNYRAGVNFGLRYRFGSIYNNVVNPRIGGGRNQDHF